MRHFTARAPRSLAMSAIFTTSMSAKATAKVRIRSCLIARARALGGSAVARAGRGAKWVHRRTPAFEVARSIDRARACGRDRGRARVRDVRRRARVGSRAASFTSPSDRRASRVAAATTALVKARARVPSSSVSKTSLANAWINAWINACTRA